MDETIHFERNRYRQDLASVRKSLAINRAGPDMCIRLVGSVPGTDTRSSVDVFLSRRNVWIVGFRTADTAVKFQDTNPAIDGVNITRTLPVSPNYTVLGAWNDSFSYHGPWPFHAAIASLGAVTQNSTVGRTEYRALIMVIFAVSEALRFWPIDKAIAEAIGGQGTFRFTDWKEDVNNWDSLSKGWQQGALAGVQLPNV